MTVRKRVLYFSAFSLWAAAITGGLFWMGRYASTAGEQHLPNAAGLAWLERERSPGRPLLVMSVHPRCPCSTASLAELGDLLARTRGDGDTLLLEYAPADARGWPATAATRELGGVTVPVRADPEGKLAAQLGAITSGHVVLIDERGRVSFHGGITTARGHRGRTPAHDSILATLTNQPATLASAPVYGCKLGDAQCTAETCHGDT